ncbi:hypothetical protein PALB_18790 [Pseudoalteromonas luteoviolacea B = ATCC 29581]|nr:hypothetical protein PALB_18790 [Pseudoalteromonas luteoviolacea B = ATCC 29581]
MLYMTVNHDYEITEIAPALAVLLQCEGDALQKKNLLSVFHISSDSINALQAASTRVGLSLFASSHSRLGNYTLTVTEETASGMHFLVGRQLSTIQPQSNDGSSSYYEEALSLSNIGIWYIDSSDKKIYFSKSIKYLLNVTESGPLTWTTFKRCLKQKDRSRFRQLFLGNIKLHETITCDFRVKNHLRECWIEVTGTVLSKRDKSKSRIYLGTLRDCTREKLAIRSLNEANDSRRMALEAGNIGTWRAFKLHGQWEWDWDEIANSLFEMHPEDIGHLERWAEKVHPNDMQQVLQALEHSLESGEEFHQTYRANLPSGKQIHILGRGEVTSHHDGRFRRIDGIVIDQTTIIEAKNALKDMTVKLEAMVNKRTQELQNALQLTQKASQSKSEFLSMMSHELRTPMNAIIGSLELLGHNRNRSLEEQDLIETAFQSAKNLVLILNDILDLNKIESGKLELEYLDFNLSRLIRSVVTVFAAEADKHKLIFSVFECPNIPEIINGDEARIRQIMFNLLSNAIKFSSKLERTGVVELYVTLHHQGSPLSELEIVVKDNGIGMKKDVQKKLFTPFVQAEKSTTRKYGGTGLGLAISGQLLELMGGRVEMQSELNKGSEFRIFVPVWGNKPRLSKLEKRVTLQHFHDDKVTDRLKQKLLHLGITLCDNTHADVLLYRLKHQESIPRPKDSLPTIYCYSQNDGFEELSRFKHLHFLDLDKLTYSKLYHLLTYEMTNIEGSEDNRPSKTIAFHSPVSVGQQSVLLIEDNPFNQKLISKQLSKLGYSCILANNGLEGFQLFKQNQFKLILTDCHMPEMDGYTLAKKIRQYEREHQLPRTPLIAVTGAAMAGDKERCIASGMDDFVSKPIELNKLQSILEKWHPND